jgi:hypothetical protein
MRVAEAKSEDGSHEDVEGFPTDLQESVQSS